ncbi:hypothetical protein FAGAP_2179 [Fusarium agapanthi]|uniref:Uncharacterized protein n=1 Tax=Fusarium agapanthi TaxID=1803897 RepID=A0A9P5BGH2_9HYPO|nr:hypothetical protein FAGAP_2179 [Fusarium agapanthi]
MLGWWGFWGPKLLASRWFGPCRAINFDHKQLVHIPQAVLEEHPGFLALWQESDILFIPDMPYHVAHVLVNFLYTNKYENLRVGCKSGTESALTDFTTAIYVYSACIKYRLPRLQLEVGERIAVYGDKLSFLEIIKKLSGSQFADMSLGGTLYDYISNRASAENAIMTDTSAAEIRAAMGGTMASVLCQKIVKLESEKKHLKEILRKH